MNILKLLSTGLLALVAAGCGGGGGGGGGGGVKIEGQVTIENLLPVLSPDITRVSFNHYETTLSVVGLKGEGFISPAKANCFTIYPTQLDISWRNSANGMVGSGKSTAGCFTLFGLGGDKVSIWEIPEDSIPLELGDNKITVTASDSRGNSRSTSVTVTRKEGSISASSAELEFSVISQRDGGSSVARVVYPSTADVSSALAPQRTGSPGNPDTSPSGHPLSEQILVELGLRVDASIYDFVLLYSPGELPDGTSSIGPCYVVARNTGFDNDAVGKNFCPEIGESWSKLRAAPHINTSPDMVGNSTFPDGPWDLLLPISRMGQTWGVYWAPKGVDPMEWNPQQHSLADLATSGSTWSPGTHWFEEGLPGLMGRSFTGSRFNAFDLYAMGLMDYEEVSNYQYLIHAADDESSLYQLTIEDLVEQLRQAGNSYYSGDGRRDPPTDESMGQINVLLVLVIGSEDESGDSHQAALLELAEHLPEVWHEATWGRSTLSTEVILR